MSRSPGDRRECEDVPCPVCGAQVGDRCRSVPSHRANGTPGSVTASWPVEHHHRDRIRASAVLHDREDPL